MGTQALVRVFHNKYVQIRLVWEEKEDMANKVFILVISLVLVLSISSVLAADDPAPSPSYTFSGAKGTVDKAKDDDESWGQWLKKTWDSYYGHSASATAGAPAGAPVGAPIAA